MSRKIIMGAGLLLALLLGLSSCSAGAPADEIVELGVVYRAPT